jgi:ribosome production factor 2
MINFLITKIPYVFPDFQRKPKTKRGKRFLENRDPKVIENIKKAMFVNGGRTNEVVRTALRQFVSKRQNTC